MIADKMKRIWQIERRRYKKKGLNNVLIAVFLLFMTIYGSWALGKYVWPQNIQNQIMFVIIVSFVIHFASEIIFFFVYAGGYWSDQNWISKYRINPKLKRPWERKDWSKAKTNLSINIIINWCLVHPLVVLVATYFGGVNVRFHNFPNPSQMFLQILIMYAIDDFFFYWFHRYGHEIPYLYKHHKVHHQFDSPFTIVAQYTSPLQYVTVNMLPPALAVMLLGSWVHCYTFFLWQVWKIWISVQNHSGYDLPFSPSKIIPLSIEPSYHDFHHSVNVGNYSGSLMIWDLINGNSNELYYDEYLKQK